MQNDAHSCCAVRPISVFVVEDDEPARASFERSVRASPSLRWLGGVGTRAQALAWLASSSLAPDVLLVDLGLPDGSGLDVIRATDLRFPRCETMVVSVFGDEDHVLASIEAGAVGYVHKDALPSDLAQTILDMKAGASPISPMIARRVLAKYRLLQTASARERDGMPAAVGTPVASAAMDEAPALLSVREQEVLALIARGFSYAEIARLKTLSVHTVQTHIKNLYGKLAVHSKNEAVFEATRLGLLRFPN
ncbi:response regulator transcription factor [Variovorax ginsengisoli]|uniref:DNA-binding NarL/FixJ family response regulator n=1 Tax=Variovorax ginsengisoli TaxID=363844 RepID=A0ABT9SBI9_9BURK|nr:response regulator transcription factor [Variovorax ginsengisoli]MDP9901716.1 DNA-binding NarL/FixJ family response regulator [Variovorax ginsengisoli]